MGGGMQTGFVRRVGRGLGLVWIKGFGLGLPRALGFRVFWGLGFGVGLPEAAKGDGPGLGDRMAGSGTTLKTLYLKKPNRRWT
jgi:hypothetical protein